MVKYSFGTSLIKVLKLSKSSLRGYLVLIHPPYFLVIKNVFSWNLGDWTPPAQSEAPLEAGYIAYQLNYIKDTLIDDIHHQLCLMVEQFFVLYQCVLV
jgi:hypothetical protein